MESKEEIKEALRGADMVFVTAGEGIGKLDAADDVPQVLARRIEVTQRGGQGPRGR